VLRLPTSWCAVNCAYLMAEDVRRAVLSVDAIQRVTVNLGDHCAAEEIEVTVNDGRPSQKRMWPSITKIFRPL
jgi:hypothetical protein